MKYVFACVAAAFAVASMALAADKPLTEDQAARFVASLGSLETLADELRNEGKVEQLSINTEPKAGEPFKPYSNAVSAMKVKYPAEHARLDAAVGAHGFGAEEWGGVGDRVMIAYMAMRLKETNPQGMAQMQNLDPAMLAQLPPEMKVQIERAKAMMETIESAPAEDQKAVAKVRKELDAYMDERSGEKHEHQHH